MKGIIPLLDTTMTDNFTKALTNISLGVGTMFFRGWVITKLWSWFVVPQFGLKELTLFTALGLTLVIETMTPLSAAAVQAETSVSSERADILERYAFRIGMLVASLVLGWCFK